MQKAQHLLVIFTCFFLIHFSTTLFAQPGLDTLGISLSSGHSFAEIQAIAKVYFKGKENIKGSGYKPYKRWENHVLKYNRTISGKEC